MLGSPGHCLPTPTLCAPSDGQWWTIRWFLTYNSALASTANGEVLGSCSLNLSGEPALSPLAQEAIEDKHFVFLVENLFCIDWAEKLVPQDHHQQWGNTVRCGWTCQIHFLSHTHTIVSCLFHVSFLHRLLQFVIKPQLKQKHSPSFLYTQILYTKTSQHTGVFFFCIHISQIISASSS